MDRRLKTAGRWRQPAAATLVAFAVFGVLAGLIAGDRTAGFDRATLLFFRDSSHAGRFLGPAWLREALRDLTSLGSTTVLALVLCAVCGYLTLSRKWAALGLVAGSVIGGQCISTVTKILFERARPDLIADAPRVFTASFPSGHALLSAVTYLTLGALLAQLEPRRALKGFYIAAAVLLTLAIGVSRVALGVHWPTDVLAGWSLGAGWAILCATLAHELRRRREVEPLV